MLKVTTSSGSVSIDATVRCGVSGEYIIKFAFATPSEFYSGLLGAALNEQMRARLRSMREEAYMSGYRDGRAKRRKVTWFRETW